MNDKLSSENQVMEYFGPTDCESIREDHNNDDLGSLDVNSFEVGEGGHRF